ncbi:MAG: Hsp20/alpha crystallin family protein [Thermodesulfobacteriota bacterium]|nr:Hsp20/alpha crystallin family protein [Thermodesulfobacteriota bacterium]
MDIKKFIPWNWFKKEEESTDKTVPVRHEGAQGRSLVQSSPIQQFHQEIDRLFERMLRGLDLSPFGLDMPFTPLVADSLLKPSLDLSATDKAYTLSVELPGVNEKDVSLEIANDTLTIRGEKKQEAEEKDKNFYRVERAYGAFQRVLSLPEDVDQDGLKARFEKGVLTVTMPRKAVPESGVKRIDIQSG